MKKYKINFDKVKSLEDLLLIIKELDITFTEPTAERLINIGHLLKPIDNNACKAKLN